jgi:spore germination cell wall hydrolase CwlJ-like protein
MVNRGLKKTLAFEPPWPYRVALRLLGIGQVLLTRLDNLLRRHHAPLLAGVQLALVVMMSAGIALAAAPKSDHMRLARLIAGDVSDRAFARITAGMDPAMMALADRFEPRSAPLALRPAIDTANLQTAQDVTQADSGVIRLQDLSPEAARLWNANVPVSTLPNPAARPFILKTEGVLDEARAVDCMTAAVYYEAALESTDGQRAVAQVVLNRLRHPAFPKTVCGVVFQGSNRSTGCQFTFTCDGALARTPNPELWARARTVAEAALNGYVMKKVGNATHYHAVYVAPYWSPTLVKVANIGAHIFYRWTGGWGLPPAFGGTYHGSEMAGLQMATLDSLSKNQGKVSLAANMTEPAAAAPTPTVVAEAAPRAAEAADGQIVAVAQEAIKSTDPLLKPEELDWAGRPKPKQPVRIAIPGAGGPQPF